MYIRKKRKKKASVCTGLINFMDSWVQVEGIYWKFISFANFDRC